VLELKQKRRDAERHGVKHEGNYLSSGSRRDSRKPLVIKSAYTNAQENAAEWFVSHSGGIITFLAQIANNLIKYRPHADRYENPRPPRRGFLCVILL
jgi:hypothetical protein